MTLLTKEEQYQMGKSIKRVYTLVLAFLVVFITTSISINVDAGDRCQIISKDDVTNNICDFMSEVEEKSKELTTFEVEALREENVKHFRLEDGTYRAISYGRPVHRLGDTGKWEEIDNTLKLINEHYITADNRVSFSENVVAANPFMVINEKDYSIAWSVTNDDNIDNRSTLVFNNINIKSTDETYNELFAVKNSSKIEFLDIYKGLNLSYLLESNTINTKIEIENVESNDISFILNVINLVIKVENNELRFYNFRTNKLEYKLLAPYMISEIGEFDEVITYTVMNLGNGSYIVSLSLEDSSSNEDNDGSNEPLRIPPGMGFGEIIIDDGGNGGSDTPTVYDSYVSSSSPSTNYGSSSEIKVTSGNTQFGLIKINEPTIPNGSTIIDAFIRIPYYYTNTSSKYINI